MIMNILAAADSYRQVSIGESALYAFLGYLIVFFGIIFLIFVVWLVGKFLSSAENRKKQPVPSVKAVTEEPKSIVEDELSEETVAVIMAALAAYYEKENKKCEFTVKRIKRL